MIVKVLRWLLVLPCALLALNIVYMLLMPERIFIPVPYIEYLFESGAGALSSAAFVTAGVFIAPGYKKRTALFLCFLCVLYSVYAVIDPYNLYKDYGILESIIYKIINVLSCLYVYITTDDD